MGPARKADPGARILIGVFAASLLALNPYLRGDGNGYYAFLPSLVMDRDLNFQNEYERADAKFRESWENRERTPTGLVANRYPPGSAVLWAPFFLAAHLLTLGLNGTGIRIPVDGFSLPYRWAVAFGSACYGFAGLLLSYRWARSYFSWQASCIAVLSVWLAGSAVVYTNLLPFQAHANSLFATTLFIYFWNRTRGGRSLGGWVGLGALLGLATTVRYESILFILLPMLEAGTSVLRRAGQGLGQRRMGRLALSRGGAFALGAGLGLVPHFVAKTVLYGSPFRTGYSRALAQIVWYRPRFLRMFFSVAHGMFTWTPILLFSTIGFLMFRKKDKRLAAYLLVPFVCLAYLTAIWWGHEGSSYGNRFFVGYSLFFILGFAALIDRVRERLQDKWICAAIAGLIGWNVLLITQYGLGLVPRDAPIADRIGWSQILRNQWAAPGLLLKYGKVFISEGPDRLKSVLEEIEERQRKAGEQL